MDYIKCHQPGDVVTGGQLMDVIKQEMTSVGGSAR